MRPALPLLTLLTLLASATSPVQAQALNPAAARALKSSAWDWTIPAPSRSGCRPDEGRVYEVGPGRALATPGQVPWPQLGGCDQVLIHPGPAPYHDIIYLGNRGDQDRVLTIRGVPGPKGELPVFDGNGALQPSYTGLIAPLTNAGMVVIGRPANAPYGYKPGHLHIANISFRNVRPPAQMVAGDGTRKPWSRFVAAIYANPVENLTITGCEFFDSSMGLFVNSLNDDAGQSRNLLISGNHFRGNGVAGDASMHNAYTEAIGTIYEFNVFGPPVAGTAGDNVKERSAGIVFRYNYLEGGVHGLSLRDPQSNGAYEAAAEDTQGDLLTQNAFVYSNLFVMRARDAQESPTMLIAHGDGVAYGDGKQWRFGKLHFYDNIVVAQYDFLRYHQERATLFQLINERSPATVQAVNNLFYTAPRTKGQQGVPFTLFLWQGKAAFAGNWINRFQNGIPGATRSGGLFSGELFDGQGLGGLKESPPPAQLFDPATSDWRPGPGWPRSTMNAPWAAEAVARGLTPAYEPVRAPFASPASRRR